MRQIITLLMLVLAASVQAQDDDSPRWSVDAHIGGNSLVSGSASGGDVPLYRSGSTSQSGLVTRLHVEYLLPIYFPLSVKAGYEHEEITMLKGDASYDLSQLSLGARWRPASPLWHVQPYAGFDVLWAPSAERGGMDMETRLGSLNYSYRARGVVRMPRFSMGPVVGAEIYLFFPHSPPGRVQLPPGAWLPLSCRLLRQPFPHRFSLLSWTAPPSRVDCGTQARLPLPFRQRRCARTVAGAVRFVLIHHKPLHIC